MKKRYVLTLTQDNFEAMQRDMRALGLVRGSMSALVDDWLLKFAPTLHKMADRKARGEQLTFEEMLGDLFQELGRTIKEE